jgi:NADPH:quinone reductase-like Zn-dependent oxidoreductase
MRAIAIDRYGGPEELRETELPVPEPRTGEVRVRIRAVSVNPVDWKMRRGAGAPQQSGAQAPPQSGAQAQPLQLVLGRDVAGEIDALGPGVTGVEVGERVFGALLGPRSNGAYAQYACAPLPFFGPKPGSLSFAQAAAVPIAGMTAYVSLVFKARMRAGETLFVAGGAGGVGVHAIPLARRLGAETVLTTAGSAESQAFLERELKVPAGHILRYDGLTLEEMAERVLAMNGGRPVMTACDFVGGTMKRLCCRVVEFDGQVVTAVEEPPDFDLNVWSARAGPLRARSASLHLVNLGARAREGTPADWETYRDALSTLGHWLETGHIPPPPLTLLGPLDEATLREAHRRLEAGHVRGKLVLTVA